MCVCALVRTRANVFACMCANYVTTFVCVCVGERARARARARVCVCACVHDCVCAFVHLYVCWPREKGEAGRRKSRKPARLIAEMSCHTYE